MTQSKSLVTKIKRLTTSAILPTQAHDTDSGFDLTIIGIDKIKGDSIYFKTGLSIQPPDDHYFEIHIRSSASELPIMLANSVGIIDTSYRGEVIVAVRVFHPNMGSSEHRESYPSGMTRMLDARPTSMHEIANLILAKKPKIAQMILRKVIISTMEEALTLDDTVRGTGGFGSSDRK